MSRSQTSLEKRDEVGCLIATGAASGDLTLVTIEDLLLRHRLSLRESFQHSQK